ncbi:hypothetical protein JCM10212_003654 [Sporobolomyces blumeae]
MATPRRRTPSPPPSPSTWPPFYPPLLKALLPSASTYANGSDHLDRRDWPASTRYVDTPPPPFGAASRYDTLQQEADALDDEEEDWEIRNSDIKQYGYAWLVPLGRLNTHEEDEGSQYTASPQQPSFSLDLPPLLNATNTAQPGQGPAGDEAEEPRVVDLDAEIEDADASESESDDGVDDEQSRDAR